MLCVSNTTKQTVRFHYRLEKVTGGHAEPGQTFLLVIQSGQQVEIGRNWTPEQRAYVVRQLETFGARDAAESYAQMNGFLGLLYREAAPVSEDEIVLGHAAVVDTQEKRAVREAVRGALAFDRTSRKEAVKRHIRPARVTAVEVEQEIPPHQRPTGDEVSFSMTVDPDGRADVRLPV